MYTKYNNLKSRKGKTTLVENDTILEPSSANLPIDDIVECEASQNWLQYHVEPFAEVLVKWHLTYNFRQKMIENMQIDEILNAWPTLKNVKAEVLVN